MADKPAPGWYSAFTVDAARRGDPYPLIGRMRTACKQLSEDELRFIEKALEATTSKFGADNLREVEQYLIAAQVEGLMSEGLPQKAAVEEVMRHRDCSRRHVYAALKVRRAKA